MSVESDSSIEMFIDERQMDPVNTRGRYYQPRQGIYDSTRQSSSRVGNQRRLPDGYGWPDEEPFPRHFESSRYTTTRRRIRTAKEASRGIEDVIMEMPSSTIGRRSGAAIGSSMGTVSSRSSASRYSTRHVLTHMDSAIFTQKPNVAANLYDEMADDDGDINFDEIRELPVRMAIKKQIRKRALDNEENKRSHKVGSFQLWWYGVSLNASRLRSNIRSRFRAPKLWNHHLKEVEGNFGSGVLSYFTFLRGLFFLSIPSFILNFSFIALPQLLDPQERSNPVNFTGEEIVTGANWFTETVLYYGYYTNSTIQPGNVYKMPLAYLLATTGYFLLCLVWLTSQTATSFRMNYIEGQVTLTNFIGRVFCAWDFAFTSSGIARLHSKIVLTELKEILSERIRSDASRSFRSKVKIFLLRVATWMFYLVLTAGAMFLIFYVNGRLLAIIKDSLEGTGITKISVLEQMSLAIIVSAINLILPVIINVLTHFEKYENPRHEVYVAVARNFVFKMGILAVICAFWTSEDLTPPDMDTQFNVSCWETELGQEVYRLVIVDLVFSLLFATFCAEFLRKIFSRYCCKALDRAEFSIVNNVMDLIYGQTLCWIGVFFSPLLSLIIIIKYFLMFYVKKVSVMQNCRAASKKWRAAQSRTMFNILLLLSFLLSALFLCVVVFRETPSTECGPYRGLDRMYSAVEAEFAMLATYPSGEWFVFILSIVVNVWTLNGIIVLLLVFIFLRRSRAAGLASLAKTLRQQIALEGQDKQLLLQWLQRIAEQMNTNQMDDHRVPILSGKPATGGSPSPEHKFGERLRGQTMTYVDPQHLDVGNLAEGNSSFSHKKSHQDPVLNQARNKQARNQRRPHSWYTEGEPISRTRESYRNSYAGVIDSDVSSMLSDDDVDPLSLALAAKANLTNQRSERRHR